MRLGIFAKTFPGSDPAQVLGAARSAGYGVVQYNMACSGLPAMPDQIQPEVAATIAAASRATGVGLAAVSGTYNMIHPDQAVRQAGLRRLGVLIEAAGAMGTGMVTLCTGTRDPHDQWRHHPDNATPSAWADLLAEMAQAATLAEARGVRLGIEPELANVVSDAPAARRLLDQIASPSLAIVLDPANLFEQAPPEDRRAIVARAIDLLGDRIVMAHAKDRAPDGSFATVGTGVIDFPDFIARLRAAGFDGDLVTHGLTAEEAPGVARYLAGICR
jgi:sugar phosphate isomerase/epimerase